MDTEVNQEGGFAVLLPYAWQQQQSMCYLLHRSRPFEGGECQFGELHWVEEDFIPTSYTACLQLMDKKLHKPFKPNLRDEIWTG